VDCSGFTSRRQETFSALNSSSLLHPESSASRTCKAGRAEEKGREVEGRRLWKEEK
jgi:hypothetical protein